MIEEFYVVVEFDRHGLVSVEAYHSRQTAEQHVERTPFEATVVRVVPRTKLPNLR
jgi:hypothetical protein